MTYPTLRGMVVAVMGYSAAIAERQQALIDGRFHEMDSQWVPLDEHQAALTALAEKQAEIAALWAELEAARAGRPTSRPARLRSVPNVEGDAQ